MQKVELKPMPCCWLVYIHYVGHVQPNFPRHSCCDRIGGAIIRIRVRHRRVRFRHFAESAARVGRLVLPGRMLLAGRQRRFVRGECVRAFYTKVSTDS